MLAKWFASSERRIYPRQSRQQRVLLLLDDCVLGEPYRGMLLDTSAGGLRLSVPHQEIPEGTLVWLRSMSAPDEMAWRGVCVKHRRRREQTWELGCAFAKTPFWAGLHAFG
jgi:hypothetical protein